MKKLCLSILAITVFHLSHAQLPKSGAILQLSTYELAITEGSIATLDLQILRSARFSKGKLDGITVQDKNGLSVKVEVADETPDRFQISFEANKVLAGSTFPLVIKATGSDSHQVKSTMIMIQVKEKPVLATKNQ